MQMVTKRWKFSWIWKLSSVATLWLHVAHLFQNVRIQSVVI